LVKFFPIKAFILLVFLSSFLYSSILLNKARVFVGDEKYNRHQHLIKNIFKDEKLFLNKQNKIDSMLVIEELRKHGLFGLRLDKKQKFEISIHIPTDDNFLFLMKNIKESLNAIGFKYFIVKTMDYQNNRINLILSFISEAVINPMNFNLELRKRGMEIVDISKKNLLSWRYKISGISPTLSNGILVPIGKYKNIKKLINDIYIDVSPNFLNYNKLKMNIIGNLKNRWHPYIVFYDKNLSPLKIINKDKIITRIQFMIPKDTRYIKITDRYTITNIKHGISILLSGVM